MTVDTTGAGGSVSAFDKAAMDDLGLGDVGAADITLPRIQIDHTEGKFKNNLSGEMFDTLRCIILGVVKQRIMWDKKVNDGDKPMCKSPDFDNGFPNMGLDGKTLPEKLFPFAKSNFNPADFPPEKGLNGLVTLPCASCQFKEWDHNGFDQKQPPCSEQHTYPMMYETEDGGLMPALFSVQKTGIRPSRTYLNVFVQAHKPMFTVFTEIALNQQSRGNVTYSVPVFRKKEPTDETTWGEFGQQYRSIREFIRQPPRRQDEEGEEGVASDNTNTGPVTPTPAPAVTVPASVQPAAAATPAPAQPAPVATPPAAAASSVPAGATASTASPAPVAAEDDDLPF